MLERIKRLGHFSFLEWSLIFSCPLKYTWKILAFSLRLGKCFLILEINKGLPVHLVRITNNLLYDPQMQGKLTFWSVSKYKHCVTDSLEVEILFLPLSCCWLGRLTLVLSLSRHPVAWLQLELVNLQDMARVFHSLSLRHRGSAHRLKRHSKKIIMVMWSQN